MSIHFRSQDREGLDSVGAGGCLSLGQELCLDSLIANSPRTLPHQVPPRAPGLESTELKSAPLTAPPTLPKAPTLLAPRPPSPQIYPPTHRAGPGPPAPGHPTRHVHTVLVPGPLTSQPLLLPPPNTQCRTPLSPVSPLPFAGRNSSHLKLFFGAKKTATLPSPKAFSAHP